MSPHILHVTEYCHAGEIGGTERYVLDLIRELEAKGTCNSIVWLTGSHHDPFMADGVRIVPLPTPAMRIDEAKSDLVTRVEQLFNELQPDVLHFHTFGLSEAAIAQVARRRGIPYVFTFHSPAWSCRRGDLLEWGKQPCDGQVLALRCSACKLHERVGGPRWFNYALALASIPAGWFFSCDSNLDRRRRIAFVSDTARFGRALRMFLKNCGIVFACAEWSVSVLHKNGTLEQRIKLCPQGVSTQFQNNPHSVTTAAAVQSPRRKDFVIGFVGRPSQVKGIHILIEGFRMLEAPEAKLRIYGWSKSGMESAWCEKIEQMACADPRVKLIPALPLEQMQAEYPNLDILAIPSVWFETGPLVLMEALQFGIPVFGSNRIGQLRLLRERGRVIEMNTPEGWRLALENAWNLYQTGKWDQERRRARGSGRLRTMSDVAAEVLQTYTQIRTSRADFPAIV